MNAAELAGRLGLRKHARDWRGSCPACGYGAFSVRGQPHRIARVRCFSCDDADGITSALHSVTSGTWQAPRASPAVDVSSAERARRARETWDLALPAGQTPAALYLRSRGLAGLERSSALRFAAAVSHPQGGPKLPAMVAAIRDARGDLVGVHRTYLTHQGRKAEVEPVKASLGLVAGGAVRLQPHDPARPLVIGEGIESAASAGLLMRAPAWSAIAAGNLERTLNLPEQIHDIIVAVDPDPVGERAAAAAAERWAAEGRSVQIARVIGDGDWNDVLMREPGHG